MISRKYENLSNVIGKEIQILRKEKHLSRATLSNKLMMLGIDINYDGIYKIENSVLLNYIVFLFYLILFHNYI